MTQPVNSECLGLTPTARWTIYTILIAAALGQAAGKILAVNSVDLSQLERARLRSAAERVENKLVKEGLAGEQLAAALAKREETLAEELRLQRPFLSANDRSRWMAIRAIAEHGDHEIERYFEEPTWDSIDVVQHRGRDGELHLYSSKPPLLMTLLAGPYWALMQLTGRTLGESPYELGRAMLLVLNGGALLLMLVSVGRIVERLGRGDFDRLFAMAVACFGTLLAAFTPVLNNHLFAAAAMALACDGWLTLIGGARTRPGLALGVGVAAGLATAFELPALSLAGLIALFLMRRSELAIYLVGVALIATAFFATNFWAHNSLRPPYAHRSTTDPADNWYDYEYTARGVTRDSYWRDRQGIDVGEKSRATYALHTLIGHHGVLSLTPVWLLSWIGCIWMLSERNLAARQFAVATLLITVACLLFYIGLRPQSDRNYGGSTSGFRWFFWLAPMWIACLTPVVDRLSRTRLGMSVVATLLALSAMSASYPTWNPWKHPWIYNWLEHLGFGVL